ncbi:MAG: ATP synthase F1 subunit epsilon [Pseudomonadota bacterium]
MAEKLFFSLVSPERELLGEDVEMVVLPGIEGDMGILSGHMDLMSVLRAGTITIFSNGKPAKRYFVAGGFVEISKSQCRVLADDAQDIAQLPASDLDGSYDEIAVARRQAIENPAYANV